MEHRAVRARRAHRRVPRRIRHALRALAPEDHGVRPPAMPSPPHTIHALIAWTMYSRVCLFTHPRCLAQSRAISQKEMDEEQSVTEKKIEIETNSS